MNKPSPLFSILIGTKDRPNAVIRCVKSVLAQTYKDIEVLILDDHSKEPLCDKITNEFGDKRIRCIRSEITLGVAGGRNRLIKEAKGNIFITLDDDIVLRDNYALSKLAELANSYSDVGIFAFKIIDVVDGNEVTLRIPFRKASIRRNPEIANTAQCVSYFLGGGHAARKEVYKKCGIYPEDFVFGVEELDLSYRIIEAGYKLLYTPDIVVEHYSKYLSSLSKKARAKYMYFLARNKIWVNYKYLPLFAFLINSVSWSLVRLICSIRTGGFVQITRGISDGFKGLRRLKRIPISKKTIEYLRDNHGRLFF